MLLNIISGIVVSNMHKGNMLDNKPAKYSIVLWLFFAKLRQIQFERKT